MQLRQRGWALKQPNPSLHAQNAKCSSTPGSRRGRHRAPRERRMPPRSARTGAAATQFGPPARQSVAIVCSSLDFNQIHDYQCECAHTILISGYPVVQVRSTVLNVECGVIESGMRFKAYVNTMTWNRP